jgi:DNA repair photolyase
VTDPKTPKAPRAATGTREWASSNVNVMLGCEHDCRYCYARSSARRFGRVEPGQWADEVVQPKLLRKGFSKRKGTVMFPTTHDITPANMEHTLLILGRLLAKGNDVLVVSKPHRLTVETMCAAYAAYKDQILFRFTIGSCNDDTLTLWEPGAPDFQERLGALKHAHRQGFKTSVSMEPMLDTQEERIVHTFRSVVPFVTDAVWLGKMNKATERLKRNGFGDDVKLMRAAEALVESQRDERILALYARLKDEPRIKWKESIKSVVGIEIPTEAGLDV